MNDVRACHIFFYFSLGTVHGREERNGRRISKMQRAKRSGRTTRIGGRAGLCSKESAENWPWLDTGSLEAIASARGSRRVLDPRIWAMVGEGEAGSATMLRDG